jgi:hypothetical protein
VKNRVVCIHGDPGIGKTSLAFTADKALCLAFDSGVYRAGVHRGDCVLIQSWQDVSNLTAADFAGYSTVVVDTAGRALDCLSATLMAEDPKNNRGGALSLQGFGALKSTFYGWLANLKYLGLDVVLVCHSDEQRKGDELITRLDMQGASKNEVYKSADMMGSLSMVKGKRILNFSPTDVAFGKNPGQLPVLTVPDFDAGAPSGFLGKAIAETKAALNKLSAESAAAATVQATWAERIGKAVTPADFNAIVADALKQGAPKSVGLLIAKAAKGLGFARDKATNTYQDTVAPKAA